MGLTDSHWWNRTRYRLYAPVYDFVASPLERGRSRAVGGLALEAGDRVLVPGCGTGSDLEYLRDGVAVTAIDVTPAMVRRTRARAGELDLDVEARVGDAQSLAFPDDAFDAVLLHLVLSVVPDPDAVASKAARVLAPDGQVSVYDKFVPKGESPSLARRAINPLARVLFSDTTRRLEPTLEGTPLAVEHRERFLHDVYTVARARPTATG
jgi:ubiquinone/menaquinone biosynthesis C-methylase UbiE